MTPAKFVLCLLAALTPIPAWAYGDAVQFGSDIDVGPDQVVRDAVCFFCSVHVEGKVTGDLVVFFGDIRLSGEAQRDVVNFFGRIVAENNATIGRSAVSLFGIVNLGQNVTVGKDLVALFGRLHEAGPVSIAHNRVVQPGWFIFGPAGAIALVILFIVYELRGRRRRLVPGSYPFPPRQ